MFAVFSLGEYFSKPFADVFLSIDGEIASRISEVRVRKNGYLVIVIKNTSYFIDYNGEIYSAPNCHSVIIDNEEFEKLFMALCSYSVHTKNEELKSGFITLNGGARVGIAASAVYENEKLVSVKDVFSLNIRIPRAVKSCAKSVLDFLFVKSFPSVIVAGMPNSGKTTLLRDLARMLSSGFNNRFRKIAVIDERLEFSGCGYLDTGINCDVLSSFPKAKGIEIATRTLSPEMIVCDEVSTVHEVEAIKYGFLSGVSFALSVHAGSKEELLNKKIVKALVDTGEFSYLVFLDGYTYKPEIIETSEVLGEISGNSSADSFYNSDRLSFFGKSADKNGNL